jgi:hypothetical protein
MRNLISWATLALIVVGGASAAQHRTKAPASEAPFNPAAARSTLAVAPTKIMVFGITHLDSQPKVFDPAWLAPVMCRLKAFGPDTIFTEAMSGEQLAMLDAYKAVHGDAGKWAGPTLTIAKDAQMSLGLSAPEALAEANVLSGRKDLRFAERRRLAALFLAAAEPFSAATQWLQLPPGERVAKDGPTDKMATMISRFGKGRGELTSMAVPLAVSLGLARVYGAGDHASDIALPDNEAFDAAVKATPGQIALFNKDTPRLRPIGSKALVIDESGKVMPVFQTLNSARYAALDADAQWMSLLRSRQMGAVGRQRVAAWEAQNLHMVTVIRETTAATPGGKAVLFVGAAHKPFIEAYMRSLSDVEIVSVPAFLGNKPAGC